MTAWLDSLMPDWSLFTHVYGPADDIPVLLAQIEADPTSEHWNDLYSGTSGRSLFACY